MIVVIIFLNQDNGIELGDLASTMMACPDMSIANEFGKVLSQVSHYQIDNSILRLQGDDSTTLAMFEIQIDE